MGLKGDLNTFELPDLLSLIATSRQSGMLLVKRGNEEKSLFFSDGSLIYASSTAERERLGQVLLREKLLDSETIIKARKIQVDTGKRLGGILVGYGFIAPDRLIFALKAQAQEILTGLFQWWGGTFEFIEGEYPFPTTVAVGFNMQSLIMEATKSVDDWARIKRILPDLSLFISINGALASEVKSVFLNRQEWEVLALVNGRLHIQDICSFSPYSDLETCEILARLVNRGLLILKNSENDVWEDNKTVAEKSLFRPYIRMLNEIYYVIYEAITDPVSAEKILNESLKELREKYPALLHGIAFSRGSLDMDLILANLGTIDDLKRESELTETLYELLLKILHRIKNTDKAVLLETNRSLKIVVRLLLRRQGALLDRLNIRGRFEKLLTLEE